MSTLKTNTTVDMVDFEGGDSDFEREGYKRAADMLRWYTIEGIWEEVEKLYKLDVNYSTININKSRGTILHVAVNDGNENVVRSLVGSILLHENAVALEMKNEKGNTPLHIAASRGYKEICECIIGKNGERSDLIFVHNNNGETPLFLASLYWQKQTFIYLFCWLDYKIEGGYENEYSYPCTKDLIRSNGDSILHCAIQREFFDLALIIIDKFPLLGEISNREDYTPLKLLATRPSAFKSGCKMIWWKKILYHCILVRNLTVKEIVEMEQDQSNSSTSCPKNYETCCLFLRKCQEYAHPLLRIVRRLLVAVKLPISASTTDAFENEIKNLKVSQFSQYIDISMSSDRDILWFPKLAYIYILGLFGVEGVHKVRKMKQKHEWCNQLLTIFMNRTYYGSYLGENDNKHIRNMTGTNFIMAVNPVENSNKALTSEEEKKVEILKSESLILTTTLTSEEEKRVEILKSESPILTAARYGIVEMVNVIITRIPSSIYETNLENKNILLVAVENKKTIVVESLRKWFEKLNRYDIFDNLIQEVDNEDNTVLHLAATPSEQDWNISGAALQMMWHIKWFQYVKGLVPEHFTIKTNKKDETAGEIFKEKQKQSVQNASAWLKSTSKSCSVVAALLAGVSFATSSTIPGGNKSETGEPALEGKPAFDAFALSSVIGLCFSVSALIMFLSILTCRKEAKDFRIDLPRKILWGLSSLFFSIVAMFIAFCSDNFFLIDQKYKHIVFPIYIVTLFPVTLYAVLYIDLIRGILTKIPMASDKGEDL